MFQYTASLLLLAMAVVCDIKTRKIKNWINYNFMAIGMVHLICFRRAEFVGVAICCVIFYIMGCIGASGWGDIKCVIALTLINGWKGAVISYIAAQCIMVIGYFFRTPVAAIRDIDCNMNDIKKLDVKIDNTKKRHIFAPYLAGGYVFWIVLHALEVL